MARLIRLALISLFAFFWFFIGFPEGGSQIYNMLVPPVLIGAAAGMFMLLRWYEHYSNLAQIGMELLFVVLVFGFVGHTLPQNDRQSPLSKIWAGRGPSRMAAAEGLGKVGLDQNTQPGRSVLLLYPNK